MAPRSAKTKKAVDVKVADTVVTKKGRGKAKNVEEITAEIPESESNIKAPIEKKAKRGRKALESNGQEDENVNNEEVSTAKKGRKKNIPEPAVNGDSASDKNDSPLDIGDDNSETVETNGNSEEVENVPNGKEKKKPAKKEATKPKSARNKKNYKQEEDNENVETAKEDDEDKPKPTNKGRNRKVQPKIDPPAPKGKKKGQTPSEETVAEVEKEDIEKDLKENIEEVKQPDEPKKKEVKGRKNQGKKAQAKAESEEKEMDPETETVVSKKKKVKKDEKGQGDVREADEAEVEEGPAEVKPGKGRRAQKKVVEVPSETEEDLQDTGEPTVKRQRKVAEEKAPAEDSKKKAPLKNKANTNYDDIDFSNNSKNSLNKEWNFKISSWNVDGIRAWLTKGGLDYLKYEKPDILCLQEVKCAKEKLPDEVANLPGYHAYWLCSEKDGYAGVGIYTTKLAMNVQYGLHNEELDDEGRIITAEYEEFYLICTYVPNAGRKLVTLPKRLQWNEAFRNHVKELDKKKPVIICGDMNVAHNETDLANPKTNKKNAGFTVEERSGMTDLLGDGFVDTFRHLNPDKTGAYTFWTYMLNSRAKNVGWRLDYFIVSERLLPAMCDSIIRDQVYGSDHCPITLFLHLTSAQKPKE